MSDATDPTAAPASIPAPNARVRLPLFDPEAVPLDPAFTDPLVRGPAVAPARLTPAALRARFAQPPLWQPENEADLRNGKSAVLDGSEPRPAAVLVPLVVRETGLHVLFTQRTAHLHDHAGQISFPGGRIETHDASPVAAALREATEEIGLDPTQVDVIGALPAYLTVTHYRVIPVVGLIETLPALTLDTFEVAEAFEVPLQFLMNPAHHERRAVELIQEGNEARRAFYAMPYVSARRYFIWGATAAMLRNLYCFLSAE